MPSAAASDEDHLFLLLLARTGRRIGELLALTVRDIDFDGRFITTSIEKRKKAQRKKMFVDDATLGQLRAYIAKHHLANSDGKFLRCMRVYQRLPMRYAAKAGIDKYFTCHSFRH
jgi:integrase